MDSLVCPFCGTTPNDDARIDIDCPPREGDYVLCMRCAEISIYSDELGNIRRPNVDEALALLSNGEVQAYRIAVRLGVLNVSKH
jgi:hypothetical protein